MRKTVIIPREPLWESVVKDTYTFGLISLTAWFNNAYCGGSWFINVLLLACLMISLLGAKFRYVARAKANESPHP